MSSESRFSMVQVRGGRPAVNWRVYLVGLVVVILATLTLNILLMEAGVWSGVDTVLIGTLVAVVVFNIMVIREFGKSARNGSVASSKSDMAREDRSHDCEGASRGEASSRCCPRCGATLGVDAPEGLCPRCLMALNTARETEVWSGGAAPPGQPASQEPLGLDEIARQFPQLEIVACLGRGGMGVVYKARQPHLNRLVALKVLAPEKAGDPAFGERFAREARTLAGLTHPNIVTVHEFGKAGRLFYLLMEYVDGVTLRQLIKSKRILPEEALATVPRICEALQYAHEKGVVHRDIKPENILIDKQGRVKIADFGIAKILGDGEQLQTLTQGQSLGTPHYSAPEQIEHPHSVDHRADIYSLGVVFYEMLTGELPLGRFAPPSSKVQVDVRLDDVVLRALAKEPERRYQKASQVQRDVESISSPGAGRSVPPAAGLGQEVQREKAALAMADKAAMARRQLKWPARGLMVSSLSGPFMVGIAVQTGHLDAGAWMFWPFVIQLILTALAAYGALKALRLESRRSALAGSIAGMVVSFLNLFCLPFAIWLLAVLTREPVKEAFLIPRNMRC